MVSTMKSVFICIFLFGSFMIQAQPSKQPTVAKPKFTALPPAMYSTLYDSCTQLDIVFITGKGGSMSLEGKNVRFFTSFVNPKPTEKISNATQDGLIMWQINGREYLTGNIYFTGDSAGYVLFNKNNHEYINALTSQGAHFLKTRGGK